VFLSRGGPVEPIFALGGPMLLQGLRLSYQKLYCLLTLPENVQFARLSALVRNKVLIGDLTWNSSLSQAYKMWLGLN
jgi:hypothetical protein